MAGRVKAEKMFKKISFLVFAVVRAVQKALLAVLLSILYYAGFGITYVLAFFFRGSLLKGGASSDPRWFPAEYDLTIEEFERES